MKEELHFWFIEPFKEGIIGIFFGIFIWIATPFVLWFTASVLIYTGSYLNHAFQPKQQGYGIIVGKDFKASHTIFTMTKVGNSFITTPIFIPDTYTFHINIGEKKDSKSVSEYQYNNYSLNDTIKVEYKTAYFGSTIYINNIINQPF